LTRNLFPLAFYLEPLTFGILRMNFFAILPFVAAVFCLSLAVFVILQNRRSFVHWTFAIGMLALALEEVFIGISLEVGFASEVLSWQRIRLIATAFLPGLWLLFALTYARANYKESLSRWRWVILASFIIPIVLVAFFYNYLLIGRPAFDSSGVWLIRLGWSGYAFHLCLLVGAVMILMNLERTLRASMGHMRWQIKYMVLGMGAIFGIRIYSSSQNILFYSQNTGLMVVNTGVLVIANALILRSLLRSGSFSLDFYPSHSFLYNSFTVIIAGIYLLTVGVLAKVISHLNIESSLYVNAFLIFLALLGLSIILLSDRFRRRLKQFIGIHLKRSKYDYRKEWTDFTQATTSLMEVKGLCEAIVKKISRTFEALCVTLWLVDEKEEALVLGGSTALTDIQAKAIASLKREGKELIRLLHEKQTAVDLMDPTENGAADLKQMNPNFLPEARIRYCAPLTASGHFIGILALDERVAEEPFTPADFDLLKTIADQTASLVLNLRLSEHLREIKEAEAFQTVSAFMMHDLKNVASSLSLTIQNLPVHFENPDFRQDALKIMEQGVTRINRMCGQLSVLGKKIELNPVEVDLNYLIKNSVCCLNGSSKIKLCTDLQPLPCLRADMEQIQKVMTNLILNANEAVGNAGEIRITTEQRNGWAIFSVSDTGCGMSREFVERSLFRPFKTTKKQGIGIGLYQSKMIVEAHQGRIEVESEEGRGTTFRVFLPLSSG
jgi:putative PEP-CTERM system histidine kinase